MTTRHSPGKASLRLLGISGMVLALTVFSAYVLRLNAPAAGFVYLVAALLIATNWGLLEAVVASVMATVCYNFFFLPPVHTFRIADSENWVALLTFLVTSLFTSQLSQRARRRTAEAIARQQELERLHAVGRAILLSDASEPLGKKLAAEIAHSYRAEAAAIYDRTTEQTFQAPAPGISAEVEQKLRLAATHGGAFKDENDKTLVIAFGPSDRPAGSLALAGTWLSDEALESLSNLVALGLERARSQDAANRAEAARQTQEFKSTLLDALAHEFKTPLTTITAAASAMLTPGIADSGSHRELTAAIEHEAARLTGLVTEVTHLARIEAGRIRLDKQICDVQKLIETVLKQFESSLTGRSVDIRVEDSLPLVAVDPELVQLVLRHLIDNAVKYSTPHSTIRIRGVRSGSAVRVSIGNDGPGIPGWEKAKVFEKFYRGTTAGTQTTGTGMGLAIAKEIISAHGGEVRLESSAEAGTEISILIPARAEAAA